MKLTKSVQTALDKARELGPEPFTPTMLGMALGYQQTQASSRVAPALKELTDLGLLIREKTKSVVTYRVA